MHIVTCPHCGTDVITTKEGTCPSCSKNVNDQSEIIKSTDRSNIIKTIDALRLSGHTLASSKNELCNNNYDSKLLNEIYESYSDGLKSLRFDILVRYVFPGAIALVIGFGLTLLTIFGNGHGFLVYHGAIIYGFISMIIGTIKLYKAR